MRKYVVRGKTSEGRAWWSGMGWTHDKRIAVVPVKVEGTEGDNLEDNQ